MDKNDRNWLTRKVFRGMIDSLEVKDLLFEGVAQEVAKRPPLFAMQYFSVESVWGKDYTTLAHPPENGRIPEKGTRQREFAREKGSFSDRRESHLIGDQL